MPPIDSRGERLSPRSAAALTALISVTALGALVWLVYGGQRAASEGGGSVLPAVNALLNGLAASLLVAGRLAIRAGHRPLHARLMLGALAASACFLASYVSYHALHGDTRFAGTGVVRPIYFFILISHIALSAVVFPAILWTLYLALSDRIARHRRLAPYTWAGWMYVSVTGIVVFLMLHVVDWGQP